MNKVDIFCDIISEKNRSFIDTKDAVNVLIINQSSNAIFINRIVIPALTERNFYAGDGCVFQRNFDLDTAQNTASSVDIYVVKTKIVG